MKRDQKGFCDISDCTFSHRIQTFGLRCSDANVFCVDGPFLPSWGQQFEDYEKAYQMNMALAFERDPVRLKTFKENDIPKAMDIVARNFYLWKKDELDDSRRNYPPSFENPILEEFLSP